MDGKSLDITDEKIERLKAVIPEAFTEGKIDWEKLKVALGEDIEFRNERYVLNWAGKSDAFRVLQSPTTATLVPCKEESVNFDNTENIFIEGENLEVLKVLQKSYFGKIKMIYIDPPYNTGNDTFIYPDKFSETKEEYLGRIGDKDEIGFMTREGLFRKNSKDSGHYHSNWLSMMYPRLFLARNLLREDGVIFVSIDDNEVHNLRLLMNEVFGEENFVACVTNVNNPKGRSDDKYLATSHEYLLVYKKSQTTFYGWEPEKKVLRRYNKIDNEGKKYREIDLRKTGDNDRREDRPNLFYYFLYNKTTNDFYPTYDNNIPSGYIQITPTRSDGSAGNWRWELKTAKENISKLIPGFMTVRKKWTVFEKDVLVNDLIIKATTSWTMKDVNSERGTENFVDLDFDKRIYPKPKPVKLINRILELSARKDDFVLDFFSGSGTTAHAVLDLNKGDGGNRKFICVQLPENCDEKTEAFKAGYKTIAEIGKERIRRVIKKIKKEQDGKLDLDGAIGKQDLGFKVFKLQQSNFKIWRSRIEDEEQLVKQLQKHLQPLDEHAITENVLYELLIKSGKHLTSKIIKKNGYFLVNDDELILILEKINEKIIKTVLSQKPKKVITLDRLFNNNDQLKTNTALQMKDAEIDFRVV